MFSAGTEESDRSRLVMWGLLGLGLLLAFPVTNTHFRPDSITYLRDAIRLATSLDYDNTYRGPGFPIVGAVAYLFGGADSLATLVLPRLAYTLAVICFTGFTCRLYGPWPALVGGLYLAVAPLFFVVGSTYQLDVFLIAWALLALWLNYLAYERISRPLAIASGVALGAAFLTKEVAILLVPLWAVGWVAFYRSINGRIAIAGWSLGAFGAVLVPWMLYVATAAAPSRMLGKNVATSGKFSAFQHKILESPLDFILGIPGDILHFWSRYFVRIASGDIQAMGAYALPAIVSLVLLVAVAMYRRRARDIYVVLAAGSFLPLMLYLSDNTSQLRQAAIIFVFHALAVPGAIASLRDVVSFGLVRVGGSQRENPLVSRVALGPVIAVAVAAIVGAGIATPTVRALFDTEFYGFGMSNPGAEWFSPTGKYNTQLLQAGLWIRENHEGGSVMTAYRRNAKFLEMVFDRKEVTGSAIAKHNIKHWRLTFMEDGKQAASDLTRMKRAKWMEHPGKLLFVRVNRPGQWQGCVASDSLERVPDHYCKLYYWNERALLEKIREDDIRYVVVGDQMRFQRAYYDENPAFERVREFSGTSAPNGRGSDGITRSAVVYRVAEVRAIESFGVTASRAFTQLVRAFREEKPESYAVWRDQVLRQGFGMTPEEVRRTEAAEIRCFRFVNAESRPAACLK